jgi:hypothetical protein
MMIPSQPGRPRLKTDYNAMVSAHLQQSCSIETKPSPRFFSQYDLQNASCIARHALSRALSSFVTYVDDRVSGYQDEDCVIAEKS